MGRTWATKIAAHGLAAMLWPIAGAFAQTLPTAATLCRLESIGTGKVRSAVDGRSFLLDDGREVRLPGIDVPIPPRSEESGGGAEAGIAARAALHAILAGAEVDLRQGAPALDRYGRIMAHAYLIREGVQKSAAQEMVGSSFARVSPPIGDAACAAELLAKEAFARKAKVGFWGGSVYAVIGAESLAELLAGRGHFTIAEGKVVTVRESGGTLYVNFGRRWSQALTVTIWKRNEGTFVAAGVDPRRLVNLRVRVCGWMEERNRAPRIEAFRPEQIEIAER